MKTITILFNTANITVIGDNKIVLQGYAKNRERQMSPVLFISEKS
jgi:hypothetical protein